MYRPIEFIASVLVVVLVVCAFSAKVRAIDGSPQWFPSTVAAADAGASLSSPVLAFDHHGTPSVAWSQISGAGNSVHRSEFIGLGVWAQLEITAGAGIGLQTALSFDRAERPMVAWIDVTGAVKAQFDGGAIQTVVPSGADAAMAPLSISHDLAGDLRGIYSGSTAGDLFTLSATGGVATSSAIGMLPGVANVLDVSLTTDDGGLSHAIVRAELTAAGEAVITASQPTFGGDWPSAVLATADAINGVSIGTDPTDGNPALAYTTFDVATNASKLFYAKFTDFQLQTTEILSSTQDVFHDVSLAFDLSDGLPAIAFEQETLAAGDQLMFTFLDQADQWQMSLVDGSISLDNPQGRLRKPSLAFDDFGTSFPAIAYVDDGESLVVAFDPPVPEPGVLVMIAVGGALLLRGHRHGRCFRSSHTPNG